MKGRRTFSARLFFRDIVWRLFFIVFLTKLLNWFPELDPVFVLEEDGEDALPVAVQAHHSTSTFNYATFIGCREMALGVKNLNFFLTDIFKNLRFCSGITAATAYLPNKNSPFMFKMSLLV